MNNRKLHILPLVAIGNQIAADGRECCNLGDLQTAASVYPAYLDACDDITIPEATWIVWEQYRFACRKYAAESAAL